MTEAAWTVEEQERIERRVRERLDQDPAVDASGVVVRVRGRKVVLAGLVDEAALTSLCEDLAREVPGVEEVENDLIDDGDWTAGYEHMGRLR